MLGIEVLTLSGWTRFLEESPEQDPKAPLLEMRRLEDPDDSNVKEQYAPASGAGPIRASRNQGPPAWPEPRDRIEIDTARAAYPTRITLGPERTQNNLDSGSSRGQEDPGLHDEDR